MESTLGIRGCQRGVPKIKNQSDRKVRNANRGNGSQNRIGNGNVEMEIGNNNGDTKLPFGECRPLRAAGTEESLLLCRWWRSGV